MSQQTARFAESGKKRESGPDVVPRWESVSRAADFYGVAPKTIREHIQSGDFTAVFFGRVLRVDLNSIDAWLRPVNGGRQ